MASPPRPALRSLSGAGAQVRNLRQAHALASLAAALGMPRAAQRGVHDVQEELMPGRKYASIRRPKVYEALRKKGMSKERAAKISNAGAHRGRKRR